jgi:hypothetical protein
LQIIIQAWPHLADPLRRALLALVQSVANTESP